VCVCVCVCVCVSKFKKYYIYAIKNNKNQNTHKIYANMLNINNVIKIDSYIHILHIEITIGSKNMFVGEFVNICVSRYLTDVGKTIICQISLFLSLSLSAVSTSNGLQTLEDQYFSGSHAARLSRVYKFGAI